MGTRDFMVMLGAVLLANLLTVIFFWGLWTYSRREAAGTERAPGAGSPLSAMVLPILVLIGALWVAGFYQRSEPPRSDLQRALDAVIPGKSPAAR